MRLWGIALLSASLALMPHRLQRLEFMKAKARFRSSYLQVRRVRQSQRPSLLWHVHWFFWGCFA